MKLNRILTVLAVVLLAALPAFAQLTSSLTGTVSLSGNPLPGATVTISSPNLQGVRIAVTDTNGSYNFGGIPPGDYTVKFEMESMQTATRTVRIGLSTTAKADAELKLSTMAEAITVTASAPAVLETTEIQTNISAKLIEDLPIGRTLLATVNLAPGVTSNGVGGNTVISGGFSYDSTFYVDGAVVNEVLRGQPQNLFIEDALQETTVQTGAISAEYGRFTGGVVTAISKSGGNEFSGSLRDNVNNARWTAQGALKEPRPADKIFNTYEATIGGRIVRDRLWFFTAGRYYTLGTQATFGTVAGETPIAYDRGDKERRIEGKLTGQITPRHTLVGTIFDVKRDQTNNPFGTPLEFSALDASRSLPQRFYTGNYNGVLTNNFLVEATYARQDFKFVNSGADAPAPPERGTNISYQGLGRSGFPTFCGSCSFPESRNNSNAKLKGSYFLSTKGAGTHNITGGYENYHDYLKSDNHQSASDFSLLLYTSDLLAGTAVPAPKRGPNGELLQSVRGASALIIWWPILVSSQGNDFNTQSLFLNDKWDLNSRLNLNIGVRYDRNHGENQAGAVVAKDSAFSPRVGLTYDVFGNGRLRLNGSYSKYVSKVANGNVGDASSNAGSPSYLYWGYQGPDITNATSNQLLDQVFGWFRSVGYTSNKDFLLGGGTSGISTQIKTGLSSPGVDEFTVGAGTQVGSNGFVRADYQDRKWNNFYTSNVALANGKVFDPLAGSNLDLGLVGNSDDFTRRYKAVLVQGSYRLFNRVNLGANYTYAKLTGNIEGETSGSGPVTAGGPGNYKEYTGFAQNNPIGYLQEDQRHKVRAWASMDFPTFVGLFNVSVLQRFDSGTPYSVATGNLNPQNRTACRACPVNPGYSFPPSTVNYYFSKRGEFRLSDLSSTDLALNYSLPIGRASLFA
ncbi:MAG: TonB-dependent receptor, partial [Acidobacteriota bacterium]